MDAPKVGNDRVSGVICTTVHSIHRCSTANTTTSFIQTFAFRSKMAELFRDNSCMHWWLPNDELYHPIIRSIRKFVEDRTSSPKNAESKDVQDMKAVFSAMDISDQSDSSPQMSNRGKSVATDVDVASNDYSQNEYGGDFRSEQSSWNNQSGSY